MKISVQSELRGKFGIPETGEFSLRDATLGFTQGSYGAFVREKIAIDNIGTFIMDTGLLQRIATNAGLGAGSVLFAQIQGIVTSALPIPRIIIAATITALQNKQIQRDVVKAMAQHFGLVTQADKDMFDDYWHMIFEGREFARKHGKEIEEDLDGAYQMLAELAAKQGAYAQTAPQEGRLVTWSRIKDSSDFSHYVIFSDHHFTNLPNSRARLNYAKEDNLDLYLRVLDHYADAPEWCLVENGDIEECVIFETTAADAVIRKDTRKDMPIDLSNPEWEPFLRHRYDQRIVALNNVFAEFEPYYEKIKTRFINDGERYVRLTGNHDTYSQSPFEEELLSMISYKLEGYPIHDILRIGNGDQVSHIVMHGHQFDSVSLQHGKKNFALSCGEVFSESTAWINEGPDRYWDAHASCGWIHDERIFLNTLARETPGNVSAFLTAHFVLGMLVGDLQPGSNVRNTVKPSVEKMMKHEIAWEYFDHEDPVHALGLEVLTGEDVFKFRHLNEINLTEKYAEYYEKLEQPSANEQWNAPILILGHTHEPRHNAVDADGVDWPAYMNSGSAGRFHNLIWCVEITPEGEQIVSWSQVGRQLHRTVWRPTPERVANGISQPAHLSPSQPEIF